MINFCAKTFESANYARAILVGPLSYVTQDDGVSETILEGVYIDSPINRFNENPTSPKQLGSQTKPPNLGLALFINLPSPQRNRNNGYGGSGLVSRTIAAILSTN